MNGYYFLKKMFIPTFLFSCLLCHGQIDSIIDKRDGQVYKVIQIYNQIWMAENLNFITENSFNYNNKKINGDIYGRLYIWEDAKNVCPDGWHLPSDEEWKILEHNIGMDSTEIEKLGLRGSGIGKDLKSQKSWYMNGNGNDKYGFNALPGGYRDGLGYYDKIGLWATWWTSSEHKKSTAWLRNIVYDEEKISRICTLSRLYALSVRCIKD